MGSSNWKKIQSHFHQAVEKPVEERERFVRQECGDDGEALEILLALLDADKQGDSLLDRDRDAVFANIAEEIVDSFDRQQTDQMIGPYKLISLLGEGGMGVVWLANRLDTGMQVAIKLLLNAGLSLTRLERFAEEIKNLGKLRHPHIARLLDAGVLDDGTPWFAMEYVDGLPLLRYCEENSLTLQQRLNLFSSICAVAQFANGQEIIHRDLKPSNILVEQDGSPRILDFGIARKLQNLEEPSEQTRPEFRFLSPDYAAPEWVSEGRIGLNTDVFSLGVVLFEMLTGERPYGRHTQKIKLEEDAIHPPKPSLTGQRRFSASKSTWSEIDTICVTAMRRDWRQRYRSIEALLRDLEHLAKNEPLEAHPDNLLYRLRKFVVRNSRPVLLTSAAVLIAIGLTVHYTASLKRAQETAIAEVARTQNIVTFVLSLFAGNEDSAAPGASLKAVTLLERGVSQADKLKSDPETQGKLYQLLGRMYDMLGEPRKSLDLFAQAIRIERNRPRADDDQLIDLLVMQSTVFNDLSQFDSAKQSAREALDLLKNRPSSDKEVIYVRAGLGKVFASSGSFEEAIKILQPIVEMRPRDKDEQETVRQSISSLAIALYSIGRYREAEADDLKGLAMARQMFGSGHPRVAESLINLTQAQAASMQLPEAETHAREAQHILEAWYGVNHPDTAMATIQLGRVLVAEGRGEETYAALQRAYLVEKDAYGDKDPQSLIGLDSLGRIEVSRGNLAVGTRDFQIASDASKAIYGVDSHVTAIVDADLGDAHTRDGKPEAGEKELASAVDRLQRHLPSEDSRLILARAMWGHSLLVLRRYEQARKELDTALRMAQKYPNFPLGQVATVKHDLETLAFLESQQAIRFR